jgi:hypothetical protein
MSSLSLKTLSTLRMLTGLALLTVPRLAATAFFVPYQPSLALYSRLTGIRDFAVGALLYTAIPTTQEQRQKNNANHDDNDAPGKPLLGGEITVNGEGMHEVKRALMAGIVVDAVDVVSIMACFAEGNLDIKGVGMAGGGAALFCIWGIWCLRGLRE